MQHAYRSPSPPPSSNGSSLDGVLGIEGRGATLWITVAVAVLLHLALPWMVRLLMFLMAILSLLFTRLVPAPPARADVTSIDVEIAPEPPKPEPIAKPEPKPEPKEPARPEPKLKEAPPAAAAQAGAILAQQTKPDDPVDLTNSFVSGSGAVYAGGSTMAAGTATTAVRTAVVSPVGVPGGTGGATQVGPDRSRNATLGGSKNWNDCPFPPEADVDNVDQALVSVQINIGPDGRPTGVKILSDPGHGFGRAARACAMQKVYQNALDREGNPIPGSIPTNIRFDR